VCTDIDRLMAWSNVVITYLCETLGGGSRKVNIQIQSTMLSLGLIKYIFYRNTSAVDLDCYINFTC